MGLDEADVVYNAVLLMQHLCEDLLKLLGSK